METTDTGDNKCFHYRIGQVKAIIKSMVWKQMTDGPQMFHLTQRSLFLQWFRWPFHSDTASSAFSAMHALTAKISSITTIRFLAIILHIESHFANWEYAEKIDKEKFSKRSRIGDCWTHLTTNTAAAKTASWFVETKINRSKAGQERGSGCCRASSFCWPNSTPYSCLRRSIWGIESSYWRKSLYCVWHLWLQWKYPSFDSTRRRWRAFHASSSYPQECTCSIGSWRCSTHD